VGPLSLNSIFESLNWTTAGPEENTITEDIVRTAFLELSLHDRKIYDSATYKILQACESENVARPNSTSYRINHLTVSGLKSMF
jgi:hypothetical protein